MASLKDLTLAIPGAGRRTLLAALGRDYLLPDKLRLCVLDGQRLYVPEQLALLEELAAQPELEILFVFNKADLITGPRTAVTRTMALLRERGFARPSLYPICAEAARLLRRPALDPELSAAERRAQGDYYYRYGPGENCLAAFAQTGELPRPLGSREVTPRQLALALTNTGVPALEEKLEALRIQPESPVSQAPETLTPAVLETPEPLQEPELLPAPEEHAGDSAPDPLEEVLELLELTEEEAPEEAAPTEAPPEEPTPTEVLTEEPAPMEAEPEESAPTEAPPTEALTEEATPTEAPTEEPASAEAPTEEECPAQAEPSVPEAQPSDPALEAADLPRLLALAEKADCRELLALAGRLRELDAPDQDRELAMEQLRAAYDARQKEELDSMTRGAGSLDLSSLRALADRISGGPYAVPVRAPYVESLNRRIDELQQEELKTLCADVEIADSRSLARIRERLEAVDCAEHLKSEHFRRIDARQEALDLEALDRVVAGAESMTEKELRSVAVTLEAGNWNPKYVTAYRHRIQLCREAAISGQVETELAELEDMERRELLALRERIAGKDLAPRFTVTALKRIDEKLYRLDMLRLLALNNDLDRLDFEGIDELRSTVAKGDCCDRAKAEYLGRLMDRERGLILENASPRVELTRQLIARHKLRAGDFTLASASRDYQQRLAEFWGGSGLEQPRDIPAFLFENGSQYAMTGERFYYRAGRQLEWYPISEIDHFQVMKQHLSLLLQIVGKDNSYRLTEARINRGGWERTLEFLNDCIAKWQDPGPAGPLPAELRLRRLDPADYTAPVEREPLGPELAGELLRSAYEKSGLREGNLVRPGEEAGAQRLQKLRLNFGLGERVPLVWYKSAARLGPVKEGIALGPAAFYLKEGKLPLRTLPLEEIYELRPVGSRRCALTTLKNETLTLEISDDLSPLLADYVRTVQLGAYLQRPEARP